MSSRTHLRLVESTITPAEKCGLGPAIGTPRPRGPTHRAAPGRPWDHLTPWWPPEVPVIRGLARAAGAYRVALDIAVTLMLERSLAVEQLVTVDPGLPELLDARAATARVDGGLGGAAAVYLRQLTGAGQVVAAGPLTGPLMIPARVAACVQHADDRRLGRMLDGDLARALSWERAAVLEHRTILEWASCQALRLLSR